MDWGREKKAKGGDAIIEEYFLRLFETRGKPTSAKKDLSCLKKNRHLRTRMRALGATTKKVLKFPGARGSQKTLVWAAESKEKNPKRP